MPIVGGSSGWGSTGAGTTGGPVGWNGSFFDPRTQAEIDGAGQPQEAVTNKYAMNWGAPASSTAPKSSLQLNGGGAGGMMGLGGTSFGASFSGKDPFATDAAAAKLRDEFARMEQQQAGQLDEDAMARGIYSSGVSASKMGDMRAQSKLALGAGLESLFNNAAQQKMAFDLESQRMQRDAQMAAMGQGAQRFGSANQNQQLMDLFNMMQPPQQGTYSSKPTVQMGGMGAGSPYPNFASQVQKQGAQNATQSVMDAFNGVGNVGMDWWG